MKRTLLITIVFLSTQLASFAQDWENVGTQGVTSGQRGRALVEFDGNLIMGGQFSEVEGVSAVNIAEWDGSAWSQVGDGLFGDVRCLAVYNNELYAGGNISGNAMGQGNLPSVCKLSNGVWVGVSDANVVGIADDMMVWNGELYVVCNDWSLPNKVMKFDGSTWTQVGADLGQFGGNHRAECVGAFNNELYVGGRFAGVGTGGANRLAKLNGTSWESVDFPVLGEVNGIIAGWINCMVEYNGELFVGGVFSDFSGVSSTATPRLASFDGTTWTGYPFDQNAAGEVKDLLVYNDILYVAGEFLHYEQQELARCVLIFDESDANAFMTTGFANSNGSNFDARDLAVINSSVHVTGKFQQFGSAGTSADIAKFNGVLPVPYSSVSDLVEHRELSLFPNPATESFMLETEVAGILRVYDAAGRMVLTEALSAGKHAVETLGLSNGIYTVNFETAKSLAVQKLMVDHL